MRRSRLPFLQDTAACSLVPFNCLCSFPPPTHAARRIEDHTNSLYLQSSALLMAFYFPRRNLTRILWFLAFGFLARLLFFPSAAPKEPQIRRQGVLDLVAGSDRVLDVQKHDFLQMRMGRDERPDILSDMVQDGVEDFWSRYEQP